MIKKSDIKRTTKVECKVEYVRHSLHLEITRAHPLECSSLVEDDENMIAVMGFEHHIYIGIRNEARELAHMLRGSPVLIKEKLQKLIQLTYIQ